MLADLAYIYKFHVKGAMPHLLQYFVDVCHATYDTTIGVLFKVEVQAEPSSNGDPPPEKVRLKTERFLRPILCEVRATAKQWMGLWSCSYDEKNQLGGVSNRLST